MDFNSKLHNVEEDRLSNLPAPLISHILSLLPTKYAVRTSSLSTFWKPLWTSITQLRFDDTLPPEANFTPETKARFVNFVERVLSNPEAARLDVFELKCSQDYGVRRINSWVSAALSRGVKHVDFSISTDVLHYYLYDEPDLLPRCLFSSRNLVALKLGPGFLHKVPFSVSLDSLKILHLDVRLADNGPLSRIVSSCPLLEELKMCGRVSGHGYQVEISSVVLKRLILIGLDPRSNNGILSQKIVLNTPALQYLEHLDCRVPDGYTIETLHCLGRARIDVGLSENQQLLVRTSLSEIRVRWIEHLNHTLGCLLVGISRIKFLHLSLDACKALWLVSSKLPEFPCLIELEMCTPHWESLTAFLESSPQLATLSFQHPYNCGQPLNPLKSVPLCMLSNLKKIEIKNFKGEQMELDIVRYFLEKSKCLNNLLISYPLEITKEKEAEISKEVLKLPRVSASCVIVIT